MKWRTFIVILLLPCSMSAQGMADTLSQSLHPRMTPLVGSVLLSGATVVSIRPELHRYEVKLYDQTGLANVRKQPFDNVLQFVPAAMPAVFKLAGMDSRHNIGQIMLLEGTATLIRLAAIETGKMLYQVERPDGSALTSFPSGHTFMAFTGAEVIRREFGQQYRWCTYVGYGIAAWSERCVYTTAGTGPATCLGAPE